MRLFLCQSIFGTSIPGLVLKSWQLSKENNIRILKITPGLHTTKKKNNSRFASRDIFNVICVLFEGLLTCENFSVSCYLLLRTNLCLQISYEVLFRRIVWNEAYIQEESYLCAINNQTVVQLFAVLTDKTVIYVCIYIHVNEYLYM